MGFRKSVCMLLRLSLIVVLALPVAPALAQGPAPHVLNIDSPLGIVLGIPSLVVPNRGPVANQVEMAEFLRPSVVIAWLGSSDALGAATGGTTSRLTPPDSFTSDCRAMVTRRRATGASLVLEFNCAIRTIAAENPAVLADINASLNQTAS